jgi:hypothetical protein
MPLKDDQDERFLGIISAISRLEKKVVVEVFRATIQAAIKEIYAGNNKLVIPFICKLDIEYHDVIKNSKGHQAEVTLEATPQKALIAEINLISEGEETKDFQKIKEEINDHFRITLELE